MQHVIYEYFVLSFFHNKIIHKAIGYLTVMTPPMAICASTAAVYPPKSICPTMVPDANMKYICVYCKHTYKNRTSLDRHVKYECKVLTIEPPFRCKFCTMRFTQRTNCRRHMKAKHKRNISAQTQKWLI